MLIRFARNKKGVSPIFVSIYLVILITLLLSTLFFALYTYGSSITERLKLEEEKQQESLGLLGPDALNETRSGEYFEALRINNTGTITIRIRALYINYKFIYDPADPSRSQDSYINPKGYIWLRLYPYVKIQLNQTMLDAYWTVTTERGTKAREIGSRLIFGQPGDTYNPMRFYIGPLMIMFDMFNWRSGTGPWQNGWSIPKNTPDVTWRILLSNIDNRDIEVTDRSSLTLISNDNAPSAPVPWYIDPTLSAMYYRPGAFYFVYYSWNKPYSEGGAQRQASNVFGSGTTCINFLMFLGAFMNPNGTRTAYGQTIPFEAVLVTGGTMPAAVQLAANPQTILNDGISTATIAATVRDTSGNPVPNAWVDFYTTAGTLSSTHATTNAQGIATVTLTSTTAKTTAYIAALCQGAEGATSVSFTPARTIRIAANPTTVSKDGGTSLITVWLVDANGVDVSQSGIPMTISVTGWTGAAGKKPVLIYEDQPEQTTVTGITDSKGQVILIFRAKGGRGTATVAADDGAGGLAPGSIQIIVT